MHRSASMSDSNVRQLICDHPWSALGAAVLVGAVLGRRGDRRFVGVRANAESGLADRVIGALGSSVAIAIDGLLDELRGASREWGTRISSSARPLAKAVPAAAAVAAVAAVADKARANVAADAVPVPNEMPPAELGLRAAAVEALGGGTHEPPLEPGAGELGARWS